MFSGTTNPYDDIVAKTTDENLTSENWELILNLCDKVTDDTPDGARNVMASILKRLSHRNPNVQLYALTLVEALGKNCGVEVHREIASRAFTMALEKLVVDRTTHDKVRKRILTLIALWTEEFENDTTLGIMEDCYNSLKAKNYKFDIPQEPAPPAVDDEIRRKEEEELQRVLEMSVMDKGGRAAWTNFDPEPDSYGASGSGSASASVSGVAAPAGGGAGAGLARNNTASAKNAAASGSSAAYASYAGGYAPGYGTSSGYTPAPHPASTASTTSSSIDPQPSQSPPPSSTTTSTSQIVTRVKALHTFEPTEPGELAFERGDIIKVVDRGYQDWWRGQLKGRTGIFPVNYVEPLPEPTASELAREADREAAVFAQAVNVERLLGMLRDVEERKESLADNEDVQELYRSCMALRPQIVKLIDKYSQKRADLVSMNETFVRARSIFDRMMEESLARHTAVYDYVQGPYPGYGAPGAVGSPAPWAAASARQQQQQQGQQGPGGYGGAPFPVPSQQISSGPPYSPVQQPAQAYQQWPVQPVQGGYPQQQQAYQQYHQQQQQPQQPYSEQGPQPYPVQPHSPITSQYQQSQPQPQPELHQPQAKPIQQQQEQPHSPQQQPQPQPQQQQQQPQYPSGGPPYVYKPSGQYPDPNATLWADYYAKGGTDPTGAVYFFAVPGVTDGGGAVPSPGSAGGSASSHGAEQHQQVNGNGPVAGARLSHSPTGSLVSASASGSGGYSVAGGVGYSTMQSPHESIAPGPSGSGGGEPYAAVTSQFGAMSVGGAGGRSAEDASSML